MSSIFHQPGLQNMAINVVHRLGQDVTRWNEPQTGNIEIAGIVRAPCPICIFADASPLKVYDGLHDHAFHTMPVAARLFIIFFYDPQMRAIVCSNGNSGDSYAS